MDKKKCGNCKHVLLLICFATKPKTNELYVNCEKCCSKVADQKRKKRAADKAKRDAAVEAGGKLVCFDCGPKPFAAFGLHPTTGKPLTRCKPCNETKNEHNAEYQKTEAGKAAQKRFKTSDKGKVVIKRYDESELGKATDKRYAESELGKASQKRYREGDAGQAAAKRFSDRRTERRHESTAMRMDDTIMSASNSLIRGHRMTSPTFLKRTSFASEVQFFEVLEATFAPGMNFKNHGPAWETEHKIPREAYDFDDPDDVKRCWSAKNVHAMTPEANMEKSWKLIDEYITAAGVENFPKAWNGKVPDAAFKAAHNAKMVAQKAIEAEEEAASEQPSGSNDVGPMESSDSDSD